MHRRAFMTLLGGGPAAWPFVVAAQPADRVRRVGVLMGYAEGDPEAKRWITAVERTFGDLGWKIGTDLLIDYRWPGGVPDRLRADAAALVSLNPDALLASNSPTLAFLGTTKTTVPIVFANVAGILASQGDTRTGILAVEPQLAEKWVSTLKELVPDLERLAFVAASYNVSGVYVRGVETAAAQYGLKVVPIVAGGQTINSAVARFAAEPHGGMVVMPDFVMAIIRDRIIAAATQYRVPAIYGHRFFATDSGLVSYGTDLAGSFSQAATYIDPILKGESPANLPLQPPARYDLVINLKAARAIGVTVPETLLSRADEVLQ